MAAAVEKPGLRGAAIFAALLGLVALPAVAAERAWLDPGLLQSAKKEGSVTIFSSVNEEEQLPLLQMFQDATGIRTDYIRGADAPLMSRITVEKRAGKESWDLLEIQAVESLPKEWRMALAPTEAAHLVPEAKDPEGRWFGEFTVFHTPAYNTRFVKPGELPQTYEEFAQRSAWKGRVAIDVTDRNWMSGVVTYYGAEKGMRLMRDIASGLQPTLYKGHLALARSVGSGEYWLALNNYVNLTLNAMIAGDPEDWWILEPVVTTFGEIAANAKAPHPNAAQLLLNFMISAEAQAYRTKAGRIPSRLDVASNPPGILERFQAKRRVSGALTPEEDTKWQKQFNEIFKP